MSTFLAARQRLLAAYGRPMTLRRQVSTATVPPTYSDVAVQGYLTMYRPESVQGEVRQGDALVVILNDEIATAAWPGPPHKHDRLTIDTETWVIQGATPDYHGAVLIGHTLHVRGGLDE